MEKNKNSSFQGNSSNTEYVIETFNLSKKYKIRGKKKEILALNNVNLKVKRGEIFGLLGPNGAGKTTMVSILTTLIQPTSGTAFILGKDILKWKWFVKENVGLMLGGEMIYHRLTGYRNLKFFCKLYNIKNYDIKIKEITEKLDLSDWLNEYVENYSTGMKVKLALARILLIDPKILFLDEPMLGLDPKTVKNISDLLLSLNKTIFLTSHQMNIVEAICNKIAFLNQGQILKVDTQENFKKMIKEKITIQINISDEKKSDLIDTLSTFSFISEIESYSGYLLFTLKDKKYYSKLFQILQKYPITLIKEIEPNLDEIFFKFIT